jgi:hypothetical protein
LTFHQAFITALALISGFAFPTRAAGPITAVHVGEATHYPEGNGDTWCPAWAADGSVFTPANDTDGFRNAGSSNLSFNHLEGDDVTKLAGTTVNMMTDYAKRGEEGPDGCMWKSSGCYAIDGVLYWIVARDTYGNKTGDPNRRQTSQNACLIKSTDGGKTWTRPVKENLETPTFPGRRFASAYFVQYGQDGKASVDNADQYIYAVSNNGFWDNGDSMVLGRVARSKIADLRGSDWSYYRGGDGMLDKSWVPEMYKGKLLLDSLGKLGETGAVYVPALHRYFMIDWYYPGGGGVMPKKSSARTIWDFYESPKPWGPWKKVASHEFTPEGYYCPIVCPKFISPDGLHLYAMTAGDFMNKPLYHLTIVPIDLELAP